MGALFFILLACLGPFCGRLAYRAVTGRAAAVGKQMVQIHPSMLVCLSRK